MEVAYWVSTPKWTCQVNVRDGVVTWAAPFLNKFVGQRFGSILHWCDRKSWEYRVVKLR